MTTDRELMQMALDALELECRDLSGNKIDLVAPAIKALRDRLAQPEPEPVKYAATKSPMVPDNVFSTNASVYTAPPSIEAAVLAEREACAKLLENGRFLHDEAPAKILAKEAAKAIRARREK